METNSAISRAEALYLKGDFEHGPKQQSADTLSLKALFYREPGKAQNRQEADRVQS